MAVTNYVTIDGMLIGEYTNGVMRNYGTDSLGSVVTTSLNGVAENTYRYKPYGGLLAKTGTAADPSFLWNGGSGYRATTLPDTSHYARRRHYTSTGAQWTTCDPLWPFEASYGYVAGNPANATDPSGSALGQPTPVALCDCCPSSAQFKGRFVGPGNPGQLVIPPDTPANCANAWAGFVLTLQVGYTFSPPAENKPQRKCQMLWSETWSVTDLLGNYITGPGSSGRLNPLTAVNGCAPSTCQSSLVCTYVDYPGGCPYSNGVGPFYKGAIYSISIRLTIEGCRTGVSDCECGLGTEFAGSIQWGLSPTSIYSHSP